MSKYFARYLRTVLSRERWIFRCDWSTETGWSLISPIAARWTQNGNIWRFVVSPLSLSLSLHLYLFFLLSSFFVHHLFQAYTPPYTCTTPNWLMRHRLERTEVQNDRQNVCACVCARACECAHLRWRNQLCSALMSVRDGKRLGVSGSVSVRMKCLVFHIHGEVCRLSYQLWSLAGRHLERSVKALFSTKPKHSPPLPIKTRWNLFYHMWLQTSEPYWHYSCIRITRVSKSSLSALVRVLTVCRLLRCCSSASATSALIPTRDRSATYDRRSELTH